MSNLNISSASSTADMRPQDFAATAATSSCSPSAASTASSPTSSPSSSPPPSSQGKENHTQFEGIEPGSLLHTCLAALRESGTVATGCQPQVKVPRLYRRPATSSTAENEDEDPIAYQNAHFHLHLHNYLSSHSNTVALSSRMLACDRALENLRQDRLFFDPLAAVLAGPDLIDKAIKRHEEVKRRNAAEAAGIPPDEAGTRPPTRRSPESDPIATPRTAIRTRFFDDFLAYLVQHYPQHTRQVMLLGCGMDARAYRLECLRSSVSRGVCVRVFELDTSSILQYKNSTIVSLKEAPEIVCHRRICVVADLAAEEPNIPQRTFQSIVAPAPSLLASPSPTLSPAPQESERSESGESDSSTRASSSSSSVASMESSSSSSACTEMDALSRTPSPRSRQRCESFDPTPPLHLSPTASSSTPLLPLSSWCHSLLEEHHFQTRVPSVWLLEGNLMYLSHAQAIKTLYDVSALACVGSFLGLSHINERALINVQRSGSVWGSLNVTWKSCFNNEFVSALFNLGWEILKVTQIGAADANYGRWHAPVYPMDDPHRGASMYVCAVKIRPVKLNGIAVCGNQAMNVPLTLAMGPVGGASPPPSLSTADAQAVNRVFDSEEEATTKLELESLEVPPSSLPSEEIEILDERDRDSPSPCFSLLFHRYRSRIGAAGEEEHEHGDAVVSFADLHQSIALNHEQRERYIDSWNARASGFALYLQSEPLYSRLADRLLELLPLPLAEAASVRPVRMLDLASGTGTVAHALLSRYPHALIHVIEPALSLMKIARASLLADHAPTRLLSFDLLRAQNCALLSTENNFQPIYAVFCSAALHVMQEDDVYAQVARLLPPRGVFIYNLFAKDWLDCAATELEQSYIWKECVNQALLDCGEPIMYSTRNSSSSSSSLISPLVSPTGEAEDETMSEDDAHSSMSDGAHLSRSHCASLRTIDKLNEAAMRAGLQINECMLDVDQVSATSMIEFQAMSPHWLSRYQGEQRDAIINRARTLSQRRTLNVQSIRIRLQKPAA